MLAWITENIGTILISGRIKLRCCTHHPEAGKGQEKRKNPAVRLQLCPLRHVGLLPPEVTKQQAGRRGWKHLRFPLP